MVMFQPETVTEVQRIVRDNNWLILRGGGSKPALSTPTGNAVALDMSRLSGIIEYYPSEYTITTYAGTGLGEIKAALAEQGQYLPFDPLLADRGATLGGTVAANLSGSGRYRYGGVRDFILGVRFVDGKGHLLRGGGKVVKNAAGFDLPKFFVGSLGRYGALVEISFKVFPKPLTYATLIARYASLEMVMAVLVALANQPFDIEALDIAPASNDIYQLLIRLGGASDAMPARVERLRNFLHGLGVPLADDDEPVEEDQALWQGINNFTWVEDDPVLVKIPIAPRQLNTLEYELALYGLKRRYTSGGNVAWIAGEDMPSIKSILAASGLVGLCLFGPPDNTILGDQQGLTFARRVKAVLDPNNKFGEL